MVNANKLLKAVKTAVGTNLVSMMVFGSYARGDNNKDSDIDLIVVVKNKNKDLISRLAKVEYELSINSNNFLEEKASKFLNLIGFKKSIFLFDEREFSNKKFNFCDSRFLSWLLIPKGIIWSAIKREGKVLCGKNLLTFSPRIGFWDKFKAPLPGIGACFIASFMLLFARDKAVMLAQTGLRWTYMNVLGILKRSDITSVFGNLKEIFRVAFNANYA
ncbi:MAG TPA: nucleotidyltransferase domain-containing protein [Candidatus Nanoarchaeia archaeon]|nr:nucleotidyltransferase domain-containing protein [Candidatus Nanoarchaeia archaeon]